MNEDAPNWIMLNDTTQFNELIEASKKLPIVIFKFNSGSDHDLDAKSNLEKDWHIKQEIETYLLDTSRHAELAKAISEKLEIMNNSLQVILLADEVAIYDESDDMISVKKINLALRIINRTFKWANSRDTKKASG